MMLSSIKCILVETKQKKRPPPDLCTLKRFFYIVAQTRKRLHKYWDLLTINARHITAKNIIHKVDSTRLSRCHSAHKISIYAVLLVQCGLEIRPPPSLRCLLALCGLFLAQLYHFSLQSFSPPHSHFFALPPPHSATFYLSFMILESSFFTVLPKKSQLH